MFSMPIAKHSIHRSSTDRNLGMMHLVNEVLLVKFSPEFSAINSSAKNPLVDLLNQLKHAADVHVSAL